MWAHWLLAMNNMTMLVLAASLAPRVCWSLLLLPMASSPATSTRRQDPLSCVSCSSSRSSSRDNVISYHVCGSRDKIKANTWGSGSACHLSSLFTPIDCDDTRKLGNTSTTAMSDSSWGSVGARYVSKWFNGAACASNSVLRASSKPSGAAEWLRGGFWSGGGGNGKSTNPGAGGNLEDGEDEEEWEMRLGRELHESDGQVEVPLAGSLPSLNIPRLAPWLWIPALWGVYAALLSKSPLVTKAITAGVLAFGGDLMAQGFEFQRSGRNGRFVTDKRRLLAVVVDGAFITGPALHILYGLLEHFMPTEGAGMFPAMYHLLLDTFLFDPAFVASFFCITGLLENRAFFGDVLPNLRREYWSAVCGTWAVSVVFSPLNYITFRYCPLELRVLSVNVCDIAWTFVISYFSHKRRLDASPERQSRASQREDT